jgi:hypothetical protein
MSYPANGRSLLAVALIGLGLLLLILRHFGWFVGSVWPLFVIVPGVVLIALAASFGWQSKFVAAAGAVITGAGLILAIQNATDYFQSWAYAWALLPAFAGAAMWTMGARENDASAEATGRGLVQGGGVVFIVLGAMFELFIFNRGWFDAGLALALLLIVMGGFLLFRRNGGPTAGAGPHDKVRTASR